MKSSSSESTMVSRLMAFLRGLRLAMDLERKQNGGIGWQKPGNDAKKDLSLLYTISCLYPKEPNATKKNIR